MKKFKNLGPDLFLTICISCIILFIFSIPSFSSSKELITGGKGIWINIWNYPANPDMYCEQLKSKGIDTIYLQISRSNTPAIQHPEKLNRIISSAHQRNMKVIGWTYVFLKNPLADAKKFLQAVFYKTPDGDSLDGMAADIEETTNPYVIETFAKAVRKTVGSKYPLIAITFSPVLKRAQPQFYPWKTIASNFDIIAPMTYWHGLVKYRSEKGAYDYTTQTIAKIKQYTQRDDITIHLIGDGQKTSKQEILGFLKAASDHGINGGVSLYPWYTPQKHQVDILGDFKI
ncbi:MAG: hypothetical protein A3B68_00855 [Candidatus Melainabacteria bacterium RIFCSPHIGHO2_02_FULL_34_12]|nr:MAG: hypothetical protein A3B68_00855 [Candidatus Melainabacteria bacterium RIFCSPHIGHO2_02_FULL_34_12]